MHNPPPFTPPDIRISPSGPYVSPPIPPGGGGIILFGADAIVESQQLEDTGGNVVALNRSSGPDVALAVTFPEWTSDDTLWIVWHLSGVWLPDAEEPAGSLRVFPTVDVGGGPQFIDNAMVLSNPVLTGGTPESLAIAGTAAIKLTNPAQPPIVQLFYSLDSAGGSVIRIAGVTPVEDQGSCWLTCAELSQAIVFQLPTEVTLQPL